LRTRDVPPSRLWVLFALDSPLVAPPFRYGVSRNAHGLCQFTGGVGVFEQFLVLEEKVHGLLDCHQPVPDGVLDGRESVHEHTQHRVPGSVQFGVGPVSMNFIASAHCSRPSIRMRSVVRRDTWRKPVTSSLPCGTCRPRATTMPLRGHCAVVTI